MRPEVSRVSTVTFPGPYGMPGFTENSSACPLVQPQVPTETNGKCPKIWYNIQQSHPNNCPCPWVLYSWLHLSNSSEAHSPNPLINLALKTDPWWSIYHCPMVGWGWMRWSGSKPKWHCEAMEQAVDIQCVRGCILVLLKSHLRANWPNPDNIGLDGSCVRWMKTEDFIQTVAVPLSR